MTAPAAVHVACRRVSALLAQQPAQHAWWSAQEGERLARTGSEERRQQFLAARWLARELLAQAAGGAPQDWSLDAPADAPPTVHGHPQWQLSISHSGDWVGCALATQAVGFDLEAPRRRRDIAGLVALCCTPGEQRRFEGLDEDACAALFYELWTVKESWIKRRREGIAPSRLVRIDARPAEDGAVRTWRGDGWFAALCAGGPVRWLGAPPAFLGSWQVTDSNDT